jgi:hypothetical protein
MRKKSLLRDVASVLHAWMPRFLLLDVVPNLHKLHFIARLVRLRPSLLMVKKQFFPCFCRYGVKFDKAKWVN